MSTKPSKATLLGQSKAEFLAASKRTYQARVSTGLRAAYADVLAEGEEMPDWDLVQDLQERALAKASAEAFRADQARRDALVVRGKRYEEGRVLAQANRRDLLALKNRFSSVYGGDVVVDLGLDKPLERTPFAVSLQKKHVRAKLISSELRLGEPIAGFAALDPTEIAAGMDSSIRELDAVTTVINDAAKSADEALTRKTAGLEDLQLRIVNVGRQMESQFRLVGLDEVADRLRLTVRSRRAPQEDEPDGGESPDGGEPSDGGSRRAASSRTVRTTVDGTSDGLAPNATVSQASMNDRGEAGRLVAGKAGSGWRPARVKWPGLL